MQTLTKTYTGAQILIKTLNKLGVTSIFGYPGGIVLNVYDELGRQNDIKHYLMRHEQAAVHAAEGYARVSGKCGVALVTSGPGATNIVTGLANAYLDSYPLVVITGQVSAELLHKDAFQEVDIMDITKSCTKNGFQVKNIESLEKTLVEAFETAMSNRKGPVVVDITKNVFAESFEYQEMNVEAVENNSNFDVSEIVSAINKSKKPVLVAGGGIIQADAAKEVFEVAKLLNIPVVSTMMGLGAFPQNENNYLGMIGIFGQFAANQAVRESDLVIAIGTRFNDRITCCFKNENISKKLVHIDIDKNEISKIIPASFGVVGDAKNVLSKLTEELKKTNYPNFNDWLKEAKELQNQNIAPLKRSEKMHSFEVLQEINDCIKDKNLVITTEVGQHQVWAARYLEFNSPNKFITSGGLGTMGFGFPAAIGACVANGNPVVCVAGDGSFQMNLQELATCVDYNLPVKIFILDNNYLGMVRQFQEKLCNERYFGTKIFNPDFIKLAESYGIKATRVDKIEDIKNAIEKAFKTDGPYLIDFVVEPKELL